MDEEGGPEEKKDSSMRKAMPSCLRNENTSSGSSLEKHRVSFPEEDRDLVTAYLEPVCPWDSTPVTPDDLITLYEESCIKHGTKPSTDIIRQLKTCYQPFPTLEVMANCDLPALEALEAVLRRVRFQSFRVSCDQLSDDAAVALFDMLEYYESTGVLGVASRQGMGLRGWQACSRMLKETLTLHELDMRGTPVGDEVMPVLCRALKIGANLTSLQLSRCNMSSRAIAMLVLALKLNSQLSELSLADNNLSAADAIQLGTMLRDNNTLRYLDVSNNAITDDGCGGLCESLSEQRVEGLETLVLWNTRLTHVAANHLAMVLASPSPLETLNIGQNRIGTEGLQAMKTSMAHNRTLKQLGVQAADVSCAGASVLAEIVRVNSGLRRVDARNNAIGSEGLEALVAAMKDGAALTRLDLDDGPGVEVIRQICQLNEARDVPVIEESRKMANLSRKISLTCETLMMRNTTENRALLMEPKRSGRLRSPAPSPVPSPSSSPVPSPSRNRFRVSRVSEENSPIPPVVSRFRVTVVEPEPGPSVVVPDNDRVKMGFEPEKNEPSVIQRKPQSGMEKLIGLFQNPSSLFTSLAPEKDKSSHSQESTWDWDWGCKQLSSENRSSGN